MKISLSISQRVWLLLLIFAVFFALLVYLNFYTEKQVSTSVMSKIEQQLTASHKKLLKALVHTAVQNLTHVIKDADTIEKKNEAIRNFNNSVRFFDNKSGYFFVHDVNGTCINLPTSPAREGTNLMDLQDKTGTFFLREMSQRAKEGGGYSRYMWPKPPSDKLKPKLSYTELLPGTTYFVGTGMYIDDIEEEKAAVGDVITAVHDRVAMVALAVVVGYMLLVVIPYFIFLIRSIVVPLKELTQKAEEVRQGNIDIEFNNIRRDEIGKLENSFSDMITQMHHKTVLASYIAEGDLSGQATILSEKDSLGQALQKMTDNLNETISNMRHVSREVNTGADQISESSQLLSDGAVKQASSLEEIHASITQLGSATSSNAENSKLANKLAQEANDAAGKGNRLMSEMTEAMGDINKSSEEIAKIIKVVDDIAFQTNLLALNAAVEAARAGQHGKGFAVVAQEVRNLASRSTKAVSETTALIEGSNQRVKRGVGMTQETAESLKTISGIIENITALSREISESCLSQDSQLNQINQGLDMVDSVTQQNSASAEETAAAAQTLNQQTRLLNEQINSFNLRDDLDVAEYQHLEDSDDFGDMRLLS